MPSGKFLTLYEFPHSAVVEPPSCMLSAVYQLKSHYIQADCAAYWSQLLWATGITAAADVEIAEP